MSYIVPSRPETLADQALYTRSRLVELPCMDCTAKVLVRKNSEHHTSIQWSRQAVTDCAVFAELSGNDGGRPVHAGCPRLEASIDAAVREGLMPVGAGVDPAGMTDE